MCFVKTTAIFILLLALLFLPTKASISCSTVSQSLYETSTHSINCTVRKNISQCSKLNKYQISKPQKLSVLPFTQDHKSLRLISLNVTWKPPDDATIKYLRGFKISYKCIKGSCGSNTVVYCIETPLDHSQHVLGEFNYQLNGENVMISPGDVIELTVTSLSHSTDSTSSAVSQVVSINCKSLANGEASACLHVTVKEDLCKSNAFFVKYHFPVFFTERRLYIRWNSSLIRVFSESTLNSDNMIEVSFNEEEIKTKGLIEFELSGFYKGHKISDVKSVNFSECSTELVTFYPEQNRNTDNVTVITVAVCIAVILVAVLICFSIARRRSLPFCNKFCPKMVMECLALKQDPSSVCISPIDDPTVIANAPQLEKAGLPRIKLLLVFVADHPMHKDVVLRFASYLQHDLGFEVVFELWEQDEIYKDCTSWMEKVMNLADKWLIIWSPEANRRWMKCATSECLEHDVFTPMLKRVKKDLFYHKNKDRYYFAYFDYCSNEDVSSVFRELSLCTFNLMEDFKSLYFQLHGMSMYQPGAEIHQEKVEFATYGKPEVTKYGPALKQAILCMLKLAKEDREWHMSKPLPIAVKQSLPYNDKEIVLENFLSIESPPPLENFTTNILGNKYIHSNAHVHPLPPVVNDNKSNPFVTQETCQNLAVEERCFPVETSFEPYNKEAKSVKFDTKIQTHDITDDFPQTNVGSMEYYDDVGIMEKNKCAAECSMETSTAATDSFQSVEISEFSSDFPSTSVSNFKTTQSCSLIVAEHSKLPAKELKIKETSQPFSNVNGEPNHKGVLSMTENSIKDSFQSLEISQFSDDPLSAFSGSTKNIQEDEQNSIEISLESSYTRDASRFIDRVDINQGAPCYDGTKYTVSVRPKLRPNRYPCENIEPAIVSHELVPPLEDVNQQKSSFKLPDVSFGYKQSIHPESFHFDEDENNVGISDSNDADDAEVHEVVIAPLDLEGDPWKSLASINKF